MMEGDYREQSTTPGARRARRWRRHQAGDHSLCGGRSCALPEAAGVEDVGAVAPPVGSEGVVPPAGGVAGAVAATGALAVAVRAFADALPYGDGDPRRALAAVAVRLAEVFDEKPSPAVARELRTIMEQVAEVPGQRAGFVDEIRLKRAHRRLDAILASLERSSVMAGAAESRVAFDA